MRYRAPRVFSTEKVLGNLSQIPCPAACATHPEHPRSPASPGLLSSMLMRKAPPARTGLEGLISYRWYIDCLLGFIGTQSAFQFIEVDHTLLATELEEFYFPLATRSPT